MSARDTVVVGGTLIDGCGGKPLRDAIVHIVNGRFSTIGQGQDFVAPPSAEIIDARGMFVLPGLMNANVHLLDGIMMMGIGGVEYLARFEGRFHEVIEEAAQIALRAGVTTVFDTWNAMVPVLKSRDRIARGEAIGARIFAGGNIVGMGGPFSPDFSMQSRQVISRTFAERIDRLFEAGVGRRLSCLAPDDIRPIMRDYIARGPDFVKVAVSDHLIGLCGWQSPYLTFSPRVLKAIAEEVRRAGLPLVSHTTSVESLQLAADLEFDVMMHATVTAQTPIPESLLTQLVEGRGWCEVQPTTHAYQCHLDDAKSPWAPYAGGIHDENTQRMISARAPIIMGTDAGCADPDVLNDLSPQDLEDRPWSLGSDHLVWMRAMVEKGMAPMDVILAATGNVARAYGQATDYGSVERGKVADLLIIGADPLAKIDNIGDVRAVVKAGALIDRSRLPTQAVVTRYPRNCDAS